MMKYMTNKDLPKRVGTAIIFAFIFAVSGRFIPDSYFRYFDQTPYLRVDSPANIDRTYFKPCDKVVLTTLMSAIVDVDAMILNQLVLVKDDGAEFNLPDSLVQFYAPIRKQELHTVSYPYPLPCNIENGRYFWKGTITYRYKGFDKSIGFISQTFNVTQSGLSPEFEGVIDVEENN